MITWNRLLMVKTMKTEELEPKIREIVNKYMADDPRHDSVLHMLTKMMVPGMAAEMRFDQAPASTYRDWHGCFPGGLAVHSINVTRVLFRFNKSLDANVPLSSCVMVGLFHDVGKCGNAVEPYYQPQAERWRREKRGQIYQRNPNLKLPHQFLSLFLLQRYGVELLQDEHIAIAGHNGLYTDTGKELVHKEPGLLLMLHWADMWCTFHVKS